MADITITLTADEDKLLTEMLKGRTLEELMKARIANYEESKLDKQWGSKTAIEKKAMIK